MQGAESGFDRLHLRRRRERAVFRLREIDRNVQKTTAGTRRFPINATRVTKTVEETGASASQMLNAALTMTIIHDDIHFEPLHDSSPTDQVLTELQLYSHRPSNDEPRRQCGRWRNHRYLRRLGLGFPSVEPAPRAYRLKASNAAPVFLHQSKHPLIDIRNAKVLDSICNFFSYNLN